MRLGNAIKVCREQKGISREKLAEDSKISISYLSLLENEKRDPSFSKVESISCALGVPLSVLLFLAADKEEMESMNQEIAEKLSLLTLKLLQVANNGKNTVSA